MALTVSEAESIAIAYLNATLDVADDEFVLLLDQTAEQEYGWFFISTNRKYQKTGNFRDLVVGNGWLLVLRTSGEIITFSTAYDLSDCIAKYENEEGLVEIESAIPLA